MNQLAPAFPAGSLADVADYSPGLKDRLIEEVAAAPNHLRRTLEGLDEAELDTQYKNWTARQIVHHLADSHVHVYIRFKWTLTEETPLIKAYDEADWVLLEDCQSGPIEPSLALLDGLHCKWTQVLRSMSEQQFGRAFDHPQSGERVTLWTALNYYPWHARHHTAQIEWLRKRRDASST